MRFSLLFAAFVLVLPRGLVRAQDERTVTLPPYFVDEVSKGPPWRHTAMPGFEILSRCSDSTTRELSEAHFRLHRLLELLLPERLQLTFALPKTIIFYDEELQPAASQEVIASMLKGSTKDEVPVELPADAVGRYAGRGSLGGRTVERRVNFLPNLRLWDRDAMAVFAVVRNGGFDSDRLVLTRDYVSYLLFNHTPAPPWWYVAAVLTLYDRTDYERSSLTLRPLVWISEAQTDALKKDPKTAPAPVPLAEFFSGGLPSTTASEDEVHRRLMLAQATLFVRWALDGRTPAQREAFWTLVEHATGGVSPEEFQRCFGVDFAAADAQLAAYLPRAVRESATLKPGQPLKPPALVLRDATEAEIARIKGDWERLEVGFVQSHTPELAAKYLEQARRTLHRAYDHEVRDPQLLAVLGLCECDAGDDAAAREFLELAVRRGPLRPRAAYELARLRFAADNASPEGTGGRLSVAQVSEVLTPLFAVREQAPPLPEIYELIAQVWARSATPPTRGHLAVLGEGVRLFARRGPLIYRTASLLADNGYTADAREMVQLGQIVAADAAERERFAQLDARLADVAPVAR